MEESEDNKATEMVDTELLGWLGVSKLSEIQFVLFSFAMMMGNRNVGWNDSLAYGYYPMLFNLIFTGSGYVCLCLCMGEMSSALPFSGGIFGFVRAALGPYCGFMVACCEFVYCTAYIVLKVQNLIDIPHESEDSLSSSELSRDAGLVLVLYGGCLALNLVGGKPFFMVMSVIGFFVTMMLLIYLIGTVSAVGTSHVSFEQHGGPFYEVSWENMIAARVAAGSQYNGLQYFPLLSGYLKEPRDQVPRLLLMTCGIFIVLSVAVSVSAVSQAPGGEALVSTELPLQYGFARIFGISIEAAKWIEVPCQVGVLLGFYYCSGKQLLAITKSGLLPSFLDKTVPGVETPYLCYTLAAVVGAGLNIFALYLPEYLGEIRATSVFASYIIFVLCFVSYMVFRRKFSSMTRSFTNPLGDGASVYGIMTFVYAAVALIFYSSADKLFLVAFAGYIILGTIFFWTYLVKNQKFSEEEKKMMFKAYLINANRKSRQGRLKNNKVGPTSSGSVASNASNQSNISQYSKSRGNMGGVFSPHLHTNALLASAGPTVASPSHIEGADPLLPLTQQPIERDNAIHDEESKLALPPHSVSTSKSSKTPPNSIRGAKVADPYRNTPESGKLKVSEKVITYVSGKFNSVAPLLPNLSASMDPDNEQLALILSGGVLDESKEEELRVRFNLGTTDEAMSGCQDDQQNQ